MQAGLIALRPLLQLPRSSNVPVVLALYKGEGRLTDRVIRWVTRSSYSHCELVRDLPPQGVSEWRAWSWSSSGRDGGVRKKWITFHAARWEFIPVPWAAPDAIARIEAQSCHRYDYAGLIGSQLLNLRRQQDGRWFCSELCAYALGMTMPNRFAPGDLRRAVIERNGIYEMGRQLGQRQSSQKITIK